jgi:hypothetical protein
MIEPTVGRVVWYRPNETEQIKSDQPLAAIVAYVHNPRLVNLAVFEPNGNHHSRTSVTLVQEGDAYLAGSSFCEWMPYQKGQAAKAEAAEAKLAAAEPQPQPAAAPASAPPPPPAPQADAAPQAQA